MPELPEVETVRRGLSPAMEGARIDTLTLNREGLRYPFHPSMKSILEGTTIRSLGRRAKYLLFDFDNGYTLIAHLGMSGSFRVISGDELTPGAFHYERNKSEAHDHVVLDLTDHSGQPVRVIYNDPRRFGFMVLEQTPALSQSPHLSRLGIEPTGNALSGETLAPLMQGRKTPLKAALLDQSLIAGLGNIYVCEALWRAGLSPRRAAGTLVRKDGKPTKACTDLAGHIRDVIAEAIAAGGSSLRDYVHADGSLGYFQHTFNVYDREGDPCGHAGCGKPVQRIVQSGRSTFFCPSCQR